VRLLEMLLTNQSNLHNLIECAVKFVAPKVE
jgi:hypothetical protein